MRTTTTATSLLEAVQAVNGKNRRDSLTQFMLAGNAAVPRGDVTLVKVLDPGVYRIKSDMMDGTFFEKQDIRSDELLRYADERQDMVINEINHFWTLKDDFSSVGFVHKRGMMLYGPLVPARPAF